MTERKNRGEPVITLVSDFGDTWARSQVELIIHGINPEIKFIPLENEVTAYSVLEGAFILAKSYKFTPRNSIHVGVVDPGVGSERRGLIIRSDNYWFVGPDNGLLYPAAQEDGIREAYSIRDSEVSIGNSATFHGRDVFAPAAALLSLGHSPLDFSEPIDPASLRSLTLADNQVARIDPKYGNIKLTSHPDQLRVGDEIFVDFATGRVAIPYQRTFADVPSGELVAYRGSHGTLELAQNLGSAASILPVKIGETLAISFGSGG